MIGRAGTTEQLFQQPRRRGAERLLPTIMLVGDVRLAPVATVDALELDRSANSAKEAMVGAIGFESTQKRKFNNIESNGRRFRRC